MSGREAVRVSGHALIREGAPHDANGRLLANGRMYGGVSGSGHGKCSCGAVSALLPSGSQRKAWHRRHKALWTEKQP